MPVQKQGEGWIEHAKTLQRIVDYWKDICVN